MPTRSYQSCFPHIPFSSEDVTRIMSCRGKHNRIGYAYQLAFVRSINRFPTQDPLEVNEDILVFTLTQLRMELVDNWPYGSRQKTVSDHQDAIRDYLGLRPFHNAISDIEEYLFKESCQLEQMAALDSRLKMYLRTHNILEPSQDTMNRIIRTQREKARSSIYDRLSGGLSLEERRSLDALLTTADAIFSPLQSLKQPPGNPSPASFLKLVENLEQIKETGITEIDLSWLNNNFQRSLTRYARQCTLSRLTRLKKERRYAVLTCFLSQLYQDTFDAAVQMHDKLMNKMYNKADREIEDYMKRRRKHIRASLINYRKILDVLLNESIGRHELRDAVFNIVDVQTLKAELDAIDDLTGNSHNDSFERVIARFSYLRQFSPSLIKHIPFQADQKNDATDGIIEAVKLLDRMNEDGRHSLPSNAPVDFIPKRLRPFVFQGNKIHKPAWESALLTAIRDQVKSGNLYVPKSKRFAPLESFFIPVSEWESKRKEFFARAGLPVDPEKVPAFLTERLNRAYDRFFESLPDNHYVRLNKDGWLVSSDPTEKLDNGTDKVLNPLKEWLGENIRTIKLPDLLIEVDNDLHISRCFMASVDQHKPHAQHVCEILATIMAHASETGPYTMSRITEGISYHRMKHISDWHMHEDTQREALSIVVNAISNLDISKYWGDGTTSSSDGQRFPFKRKVLYKSYSHAFNDFALEFYNFVADNFAPYYSLPHECSDRDAPFVLDGILYNESDLDIQEHYTDTHGFTDTNFAAFAMYGKRFSPRIKGLHKHAIFRLDKEKDYGDLSVLLEKRDRTLNPEWISDQWDRMGHFYASLESGHATASTALRRLNGFTGKNHFYRANRELGRAIRTEHTLDFMSDPDIRKRTRRGLLKGEQIHSLARDIRYGHRGKLSSRNWLNQKHSCSCLTLAIACIIYWQAKEIHRVIEKHPLPEHINLDLLSHISPVSWENIILYGDYILNRSKVIL